MVNKPSPKPVVLLLRGLMLDFPAESCRRPPYARYHYQFYPTTFQLIWRIWTPNNHLPSVSPAPH